MDSDFLEFIKKQSRKGRAAEPTVQIGTSAPPAVQQSTEWKLVLCHVPVYTRSTHIENYFQGIMLKEVRSDASYGKWRVVEAHFRTEEDRDRALEDYSYQFLQGHKVTLKVPEDAEEEMNRTASCWEYLPYYLVDDCLRPLAPYRSGKLLTRVCRTFKDSLERVSALSYPGMFVEPELLNYATFRRSIWSHPRPISEDVTHIVLLSPYSFHGLEGLFVENKQIKQLTILAADCLKVHDLVPWNRPDDLWKNLRLFSSTNSYFHFSISVLEEQWTLAMFIPQIEPTLVVLNEGSGENYDELDDADFLLHMYKKRTVRETHERISRENSKRTNLRQQIFSKVEEANLWWPYPADQTEWLRSSLEALPADAKQAITMYLFSRNNLGDSTDRSLSSLNVTSTGITFDQWVLDKRDCAFIGHFIASLDAPDIRRPPHRLQGHFRVGPRPSVVADPREVVTRRTVHYAPRSSDPCLTYGW